MRLTAELAATRLLSFLLRLAATPCAARHSLSTSAHCLVNVMRRHGLMSHAVSVKHYEALWFRMFIIMGGAQWGQAPMRPFAWEKAKGKAALAVNTELLEANWQTGRYIVEFEQQGNAKARYGEQLLTNLSRDLTKLRGKGYSRSNLFNMRLFYVRFPKIQTVPGQLTWSHYLELLKCDDPLEMQFYMKECINQGSQMMLFPEIFEDAEEEK